MTPLSDLSTPSHSEKDALILALWQPNLFQRAKLCFGLAGRSNKMARVLAA